jgi:Xaa-Pro aminopeptidase
MRENMRNGSWFRERIFNCKTKKVLAKLRRAFDLSDRNYKGIMKMKKEKMR